MRFAQRVAPAFIILGVAASTFAATKHVQDDLSKRAKISEPEARKIALARVPGQVKSEELKRERHRIVYSYDIKLEGKSGVEEVLIDAMTGRIVSVKHESEATEKKEAK
jgi:uncharacterized membrane protein YkoI